MSRKRKRIIFRPVLSVRDATFDLTPPECDGTKGDSILIECERESGDRRTKNAREPQSFGTALLHLFNRDFVEYVRQEQDGTYTPVLLPKSATHRLKGTSWNKDASGQDIVDHGYALSVCADPLRPRLRRTTLVVKRVPPVKGPIYKVEGDVKGKRSVIRFLVLAMHAKVHLRTIPTLTDLECDQLYNNLIRAGKLLKLRKLFAD